MNCFSACVVPTSDILSLFSWLEQICPEAVLFSTVSWSEHINSSQGFFLLFSWWCIVCTVGLYERSGSVRDQSNCWSAITDDVLSVLDLYILSVTRFPETTMHEIIFCIAQRIVVCGDTFIWSLPGLWAFWHLHLNPISLSLSVSLLPSFFSFISFF